MLHYEPENLPTGEKLSLLDIVYEYLMCTHISLFRAMKPDMRLNTGNLKMMYDGMKAYRYEGMTFLLIKDHRPRNKAAHVRPTAM